MFSTMLNGITPLHIPVRVVPTIRQVRSTLACCFRLMSSVKSFFKPRLFPAFHKDSQLANAKLNEMKITHVAILLVAIFAKAI